MNWRTAQLLLENGVFLVMGFSISSIITEVDREHLSVWGAVGIGLHRRRGRARRVLAQLELERERVAWMDGLAAVADQPRPCTCRLARSHRSLARPRWGRAIAFTRTDHGLDRERAVAGNHQHLDTGIW